MKCLDTMLLGGLLAVAGCGLFGGSGDRTIVGSGQIAAEARPVSGFDAVALLGSGEVSLTQGATESLVIEADDNLLPLIISTVRGTTLALGFDRANWRDVIQPSQPIRYTLTVRDLSAIDLSGSGLIAGQSVETERLAINLSGAGDVNFGQLQADALEVTLGGSGNVTLAGLAAQQRVDLLGSGTYQAGALESQAAEVNLRGSGDLTLWVRDRLDVTISGSGTVSYFGQPTVGRRDITGSGDINPMGEK